ncbi:MAG: hypothetical protein H6636_12580 [Anaerolineales bacterium]|nr:hypothetical protein [Anaerolineales bacterium]
MHIREGSSVAYNTIASNFVTGANGIGSGVYIYRYYTAVQFTYNTITGNRAPQY